MRSQRGCGIGPRYFAAARCAFVILLWLFSTAGPARGAQEEPADLLERRVKAALLYRFINYVEWPESAFTGPNAPFTIAIAGADRLASELADFATGRTVLNRPLSVRRLQPAEPAKDSHIVFVAKQQASQFAAILRAVPQNTLVVTEWDSALGEGSVINFRVVDGQVRFEVSLEAAQKRSIRLSSRLLSVAHDVRP
jgi:hypothetical protein